MISSDQRAIENVNVESVPLDALLAVHLKAFTMKYEFDNGRTPYHTWLTDDVLNAGQQDMIQNQYWDEQIPDLQSIDEYNLQKRFIYALCQKVIALEQRIVALEAKQQ